jgi:hypothetical protein
MTTQTATSAQINYLRKLIDGKEWPAAPAWQDRKVSLGVEITSGLLTKKTASLAIETLKDLPWAPKTTDTGTPAEEGYYVLDNKVYRVRTSKAGRRYALVLTATPASNGSRRYSWEYTKGVVYRLTERLTVEEAAKRGHLDGVCIICCKALTDPESVERGIGPVCVSRL